MAVKSAEGATIQNQPEQFSERGAKGERGGKEQRQRHPPVFGTGCIRQEPGPRSPAAAVAHLCLHTQRPLPLSPVG